MAHYFTIMQGLRGCYMPDNAHTIQCATRRELKSALESEAYYIRDAGFVGCNKRDIAALAAECWRRRKGWQYDLVAPYRNADQDSYPYGLMVAHATRAEYMEYIAECDSF